MKPKQPSQPQMAGAVGFLAVVAAIIHAALTRRTPEIEELTLWVSTVAAAWGNWMSRQWNQSSEVVGCQTQPPAWQPARPVADRTQVVRRNGGNPSATPMIAIALLIAVTTSGCILNRRDKGDIVSITSQVIGIDVSQSPADGATPHFRLGYVRSEIHLVPTVKTSNGIAAPNLANSQHMDARFGSTSISEDFATGDAADNLTLSTEPTTAQRAIIAATNRPPAPK